MLNVYKTHKVINNADNVYAFIFDKVKFVGVQSSFNFRKNDLWIQIVWFSWLLAAGEPTIKCYVT